MNKTQKLCKQCGKCCYFEIPLTILDIHRIAQYIDENDQAVFNHYIQKDYISEKAGLFAVKKNDDRSCIFLDEEKKCSIHQSKPRTCEFFICSHLNSKDEMPWTAEFSDLFDQSKLWEQSIASMVTKAYIKKNHTRWNETDFYKSLLSIYENIKTEDTEKIKLASDGNRCPIGLVYDCSKCSKKGVCAEETVITIDDMRRIVQEKNISWNNLFNKYIDNELSISGDFKLIRNKGCIFLDKNSNKCSIETIKPMHCKFTPCPQKTKDSPMFDYLYLGSGTVEEQFRHQVSIAVTKEYAQNFGLQYSKKGIDNALQSIDNLISNHIGFDEFCKKIASYRYVDDTIQFKHKKNK